VTFLFSGVSRIQELSPYWASALINTTVLEIGFLDETDARELIASPVKDFPEIYRPAAVNRIISLTHCQPYLIQLMCSLLVERMNAKRRMPPTSWVEVEDVEAVVPLALKQGENYFTDHWQSQIGGDLARDILRKIAVAKQLRLNFEDINKNIFDESALRETLKNLIRREIIEIDNGSFQITVPLVAEFVKRENVF
jgi:hypothetical protein